MGYNPRLEWVITRPPQEPLEAESANREPRSVTSRVGRVVGPGYFTGPHQY